MGRDDWSKKFYDDRKEERARTGASAFTHTDETLRSTPRSAWTCHADLNPFGVKFRESRDSEKHPLSKPIGVICDNTGSMGRNPRIIHDNQPKLMGLLLTKGLMDHPQIMMGAHGDAYSDRAPVQFGQFESGNAMEGDLAKFLLEGQGGPFGQESYELVAYFFARHTSCDAWEKRGEKGYLFLIGDEKPYPTVSRELVKKYFGDDIPQDIKTEDIFKELQERWEVFMIIPSSASGGTDGPIRDYWVNLLSQNVLTLEDPAAICDVIAMAIGIMEGKADLDAAGEILKGAGTSEEHIGVTTRALATLKNKGDLRRASSVDGDLETASGGGRATRV